MVLSVFEKSILTTILNQVLTFSSSLLFAPHSFTPSPSLFLSLSLSLSLLLSLPVCVYLSLFFSLYPFIPTSFSIAYLSSQMLSFTAYFLIQKHYSLNLRQIFHKILDIFAMLFLPPQLSIIFHNNETLQKPLL